MGSSSDNDPVAVHYVKDEELPRYIEAMTAGFHPQSYSVSLYDSLIKECSLTSSVSYSDGVYLK